MRKSAILVVAIALFAGQSAMAQFPGMGHRNGSGQQNEATGQPQHRTPGQQPAVNFTPEQFRERQQQFLTERSGLTAEEAEKFFPIYFELQGKKNDINAKARQTVSNASRENGHLSDDDYNKLIDNLADAKIQTAKLEKDYLEKFKKIVPASKLLRIQIAETQFGSEMIKDIQRNAMHINGNRFPGIANMWNHMAVPFGFQPNGNPGAMQIPGMPGMPFRPDGNNQKQQQNNNNEKK